MLDFKNREKFDIPENFSKIIQSFYIKLEQLFNSLKSGDIELQKIYTNSSMAPFITCFLSILRIFNDNALHKIDFSPIIDKILFTDPSNNG